MGAFVLSVLLLFNFFQVKGQLTPQEAISLMKRGINIGNTMDPPYEGAWGNPPIKNRAFEDYKNAGFTAIRIPITWDKHTSTTSPYTIDKSWLDHVEQVVDSGLKRNLIIIINAHHEGWLKDSYTNANVARFDSIWSQIATRLQHKSDNLVFEMLNEPHPMSLANLNNLNKLILLTIRKTNPTRIVVFSGSDWTSPADLVNSTIPDPNDNYLIGYYHSYNPYPFGLKGTGTYGTDADLNQTKAEFDKVYNWSRANNIPIILGEFGAQKLCEYNSRMTYYAAVIDQALKHGIPFFAWDDGGDFAIYNRTTGGFNEIKDILINTYPESPNKFKYSFTNTGLVKLTWENRTTTNDSIIIERSSTSASDLSPVFKLLPTSTQFIDSTVKNGMTYYYRLTTKVSGKIIQSCPIKTGVVAKTDLLNLTGKSSFILYPNPALNHYITLKNSTNGDNVKVDIFDLNGKLMRTCKVKEGNSMVNLEGLIRGNYFFVISAKDLSETKQISVL